MCVLLSLVARLLIPTCGDSLAMRLSNTTSCTTCHSIVLLNLIKLNSILNIVEYTELKVFRHVGVDSAVYYLATQIHLFTLDYTIWIELSFYVKGPKVCSLVPRLLPCRTCGFV